MITQTPTFKYNPIPNIAPYVRDAIDRIMGNISKEEYVQLADFLNGVQNDIVGYNHEHDDALRNSDIEYRTTDILIHGQGEIYKLDISINLEGDINYAELITPENEIISANLSFASLSPKQLIVISLADGLVRGILGIMFSDEELQERLDSINEDGNEEDDRFPLKEDALRHLRSFGYDPDSFEYDGVADDIPDIARSFFMTEEDPWLSPDDFKYLTDAFVDMSYDSYGDVQGFSPTMRQQDKDTGIMTFLYSLGEDTLTVEIKDGHITTVTYYNDDVERRIDNHPDISDFEKIFIIIGHGCMMSYGYYLAVQEKKVV